MAFGREVGRVLSDGRLVGRTEPFAKVFPTSREVKRAVGAVGWVILEDVALDAGIDADGRLVAETNVRRIAANLGMSKTTVHKHLVRLRDFGFVLHEELRDDASGRYEFSRYVIDPSACVERFARTAEPCTRNWDTDVTVSQSTGHGDLVQNNKRVVVVEPSEQQQPCGRDVPDRELLDALTAVGVSAATASELVTGYPAEQIRDALSAVAAQPVRNSAGWVVTAIRAGWDLSAYLTEQREEQARREREAAVAIEAGKVARAERQRATRAAAWSAAVSAALDDSRLAAAIEQVTRPVPGLERRSAPHVQAQLVRWAAGMHSQAHGQPLDRLLTADLRAGARPVGQEAPGELPPPPDAAGAGADLGERVRRLLGAPPRGSPPRPAARRLSPGGSHARHDR
ncbi:hypothetical protein BH20ACT9_BH20ACT9_07320 [soil metagenome]